MNRFDDNLICTSSNEGIVSSFLQFGVEFLVVGGLAMAWHCSSRQADDMDLMVNPTPENSKRVSDALMSLGLSGLHADSFARTGVQAPFGLRIHTTSHFEKQCSRWVRDRSRCISGLRYSGAGRLWRVWQCGGVNIRSRLFVNTRLESSAVVTTCRTE